MIPRTVKEYRIKWQHERGNPMLMYLYNADVRELTQHKQAKYKKKKGFLYQLRKV